MSCSRRFWNTKITYDITLFMSKRRTNCHMSYFENCEFSLLPIGLLHFLYNIQPKFFTQLKIFSLTTKFFHSQLKFFLSQPKFFLTQPKFFHSQPKIFSLTTKFFHSQLKFFTDNKNFSLTTKIFSLTTKFSLTFCNKFCKTNEIFN